MSASKTARKINVLLVDDHTLVREGFRTLLNAQPDMHVVGEAESGRQAVQLARQLQPDVIVMDLAMQGLNGMEATRRIVQEAPAAKVLILSCYGDDEYVQQSAEAGVAGYLLKQTAVTDVVAAIRQVSNGKSFFGPAISKKLIANYRQSLLAGKSPRRAPSRLTSREAEVLQLIAEGKTNKEIAADLKLSIKTIDKNRTSLMTKLGIHDIAGLTRYAIAKRMVEVSPGLEAA